MKRCGSCGGRRGREVRDVDCFHDQHHFAVGQLLEVPIRAIGIPVFQTRGVAAYIRGTRSQKQDESPAEPLNRLVV